MSLAFKRSLMVLLTASAVGSAVSVAGDDSNLSHLRDALAQRLEVSPDDIRPSPVPGLFEVKHGHQFAYVSADGKYLLKGDLIEVDSGTKITDNRRRADRLESLAALSPSDFIVFAPPQTPKYVVTAFTDVDCAYCRKMHSQIKEYNALGIEIRYLSFPRTGPDTPSWHKAQTVWCADDRQSALTRAKLDKSVVAKRCDDPVAKEYQLGTDFDLEGTPLLILPDGEAQAGYLPPEDLLAELTAIDAETQLAKTRSAQAAHP